MHLASNNTQQNFRKTSNEEKHSTIRGFDLETTENQSYMSLTYSEAEQITSFDINTYKVNLGKGKQGKLL